MNLSHADFQKARRISRAIQEHLENTGQANVRTIDIFTLSWHEKDW